MRLRQRQVSTRELDGETVILDLASSQYLTVNEPGTVLLDRLQQDRTEADLVAALVAEFDVDQARAEADVSAFVESLRRLGLLDDTEPT
jgi:PqqD family protein of HPr-rel-A system